MIIAFTGKARSGKNTLAELMEAEIQEHGLDTYSFALAGTIKKMINLLGLFPPEQWEDGKEDIIPSLGVSPRHMAQTLGTEWGRNLVNKDLWMMSSKRKLIYNPADVKLVTDLRFDNEAKMIKTLGGYVIRIERDDAEQVLDHPSEHGVSEALIDKVVYNNAGLCELEEQARGLVKEYVLKK